jgi:hypothetical protein
MGDLRSNIASRFHRTWLLDFFIVNVLASDFRLLLFLCSVGIDAARVLIVAELLGSGSNLEKKRSGFIQNVDDDAYDEKKLEHGALF